MNELFTDPFAAHVYQAILHTLNGQPLKNTSEQRLAKRRKTQQEDSAVYHTPQTFADLLKRFLEVVKLWDKALFQTLVFDKYAVPLLQMVIEKDRPKRKISKGKPQEYTIGELILSGNDPNSKGWNMACSC